MFCFIPTQWLRVDLVLLGQVQVYFCVAVQFCWKANFIWDLLRAAEVSIASMKDNTTSRFGLQRKMSSCIKLDEIDTENGICFPIHVVVSVSLKISSSTEVTKFKNSHVVKEFFVACIRDAKRGDFIKRCFTDVIQVLGGNTFNSFLVNFQMPLQVCSIFIKLITWWVFYDTF